MYVAVDSLHANYSFKYFGKDKGITLYTFLDERQSLFHSQIFSPSDREAAYVIDGLLDNDVLLEHIHSTDSHGYTEQVFATAHFVDVSFAPCIKNIESQRIYAFSARRTYQKRGYVLVPSRTINQKLIVKHWDDILRFMATIKTHHATASQLFKRLSFYAQATAEKQGFIRQIESGSVISWRHVNLRGEYDFRPAATNGRKFDFERIKSMKIN